MAYCKYVIPDFNFYLRDLDWYAPVNRKNLNTVIYDCIIDYLDENNFDIDAGDVFDSAYLLCTKVCNDERPENKFNSKYPIYGDIQALDNDGIREMLSWWTAYTILNYYYRHNGGENIRRFLSRATKRVIYFHNPYFTNVWNHSIDVYIAEEVDRIDYANQLAGSSYNIDLSKEDIPMPYDFSLEKPLPFPSENDPWQKWTSNFDKDVVLFVLDSYIDPNVKLKALECIEKAWKYYNEHKDDLPF